MTKRQCTYYVFKLTCIQCTCTLCVSQFEWIFEESEDYFKRILDCNFCFMLLYSELENKLVTPCVTSLTWCYYIECSSILCENIPVFFNQKNSSYSPLPGICELCGIKLMYKLNYLRQAFLHFFSIKCTSSLITGQFFWSHLNRHIFIIFVFRVLTINLNILICCVQVFIMYYSEVRFRHEWYPLWLVENKF